jgi:branched-chain amino acid transport system ATP-binding protein
MLELSSVSAHYAKNQVLRAVDLKVAPGEVVALIGANAAGKSTTMRVIAGLKRVTSGAIKLDDIDIEPLSTPRRVRLGIALVPEGRQIFAQSTVLENLIMGAYHRPDRNAIQHDIDAMFAMFPRLGERRHQRAGSMSGGEQQMAAIARGLMAKPKCLLLDEPTLGLAPVVVDEISLTIMKLAQEGMTILLAEQNAAMALDVANRAYVLAAGAISAQGTPDQLKASPLVEQLYFGGAPSEVSPGRMT